MENQLVRKRVECYILKHLCEKKNNNEYSGNCDTAKF